MEYRKENHFIVAYKDGQCRGKWDILTNQYIGIKGGVLKSKPASFSSQLIEGDMNLSLRSAFYFIGYADRWNPFTLEHGKRIEEVLSVGLKLGCDWQLWREFISNQPKLTKDFVAYINTNYDGVYSCRSIHDYNIYKNYRDTIDKCGDNKQWATEAIARVDSEVPVEFVKGMILRAVHEKVFMTEYSSDFGNIINRWYNYITFIGDKLEVKHNILTNYAILKWIYEEYKNAHCEENLKKYNDKNWLYFEDDNYIVTPLLNRADFHKEAEAQGNCVERLYMEKVALGETHVVVVRKKNNPNASYITCEVNNRGQIVQYLLKYNRYPTNELDIDFKVAYATHLKSSLKE